MARATRFETDGTDEQTHRTRPAWNPGGDETSRLLACRNAGCDNDHVDPEFARILGDGDAVYACPECTSWAALKGGAAADPEFDHRVDDVVSRRRASEW
ncbi:DUF7563 family protein [Halomicrococcus sp. SG-WS-1]|uniref:DUF7563 family protein n=1 Tax=Halomicrococcus sp. SG-WS-1 TaxID=3439057 RepID=UPI003F79AE95